MPLRTDLLQPIQGPNPAGAYLRWDSADTTYLELENARREDDDLPQGEWEHDRKTADYGAVVKIAADALATKSKDLQIAAYLVEALAHREGFGGLRQGLELLHSLIDEYWDHLYPELDEDGDAAFRAAPLAWLGGDELGTAVRSVPLNDSGHSLIDYKESRTIPSEREAEADSAKREAREQAIADGKLTPEAFDSAFDGTKKPFYKALVADLDSSLESVKALDGLGEEKFGDAAPSYLRLREALDEVRRVAGQLLDRKLEQDPDPPEPVAVVEGSGGDAAAAGAVEGSAAALAGPGTLTAEPRSRDDAAARIAAAARFMRAEKPTDPAPYALLRGFRWGELRSDGGTVDPKLLSAPPTDVRTRLKTLLLDAKWGELLEAAEEVMATPYGRGWLDLQRYVLTACDGLGAEYDAVASVIRGALRSLLRDLPDLPDLTLMDDSPTANRETRSWLRDEGLFRTGADEEEPEAANGAVDRRPGPGGRGAIQRAVERARAGQPEKAIELLLREVEHEKSARARFLRRSQVTEIMVDSGLHSVALPMLKDMLGDIEAHRLEEWEDGETVALPLGLLYRCMDRLDVDMVESENKEALYQRVCRLDPLQAIRFANGSVAEDDSTDESDELRELNSDAAVGS